MSSSPSSSDSEEGSAPWWRAAFGEDYDLVYGHRDGADARADVRALDRMGLRGPLLDACAGWGRHLREFRETGLPCVGLELSVAMLRRAAREGISGLARGDVRRLPFRDGAFRSVVSLFQSFGYWGEAADAAALAELARVAAPGGQLVLDVLDPVALERELVPWSRDTARGVSVRRRLVGKHVHKEVSIDDGGKPRGWTEVVRLYGASELLALVRAAGWEPEGVDGALDGRPVNASTARLVVRARRP